MKIIGIIPARMESSRFPGKPLADLLGMPMIGHVYHRCKMSNILDEVYVEFRKVVFPEPDKPVIQNKIHLFFLSFFISIYSCSRIFYPMVVYSFLN